MLTENSKKIVLKLGSSTVVDHKGAFKTNWVTSLIKDIKKYVKNKDFVIVSSGAIALGHPLGCTGAKLSIQLLNEMKRRNQKYGMVTACVGGGQGIAGIYERL